jgi:alpha-1,3-rhamnosyl/mannosyltransferase
MNIAFDPSPVLSESKTGIGYYTESVIKEIIKNFPDNNYSLEYFSFKGKNDKFVSEFLRNNVKPNPCKWFKDGWYKLIRSFIPVPYPFFFGKTSDVYLFCNFYVPPFVSGKKILVVHDLVFRDLPETVNFKTKTALNLLFKKSLKYADAIITDSDFTKERLFHYYPFTKEKQVKTVYCGVYAERFSAEGNISGVKQKYNIGGNYFIYLGTIEPRKNLQNLIKAYNKFLLQNSGDLPKLVIAGGKGWLYGEIFSTVKDLHLEQNVIFTGYVDETDIAALIKGADIFCFVTLYEGFGLPVLEAMACGTAVISSGTSAIPETAGDAALLINPLDINGIADGLTMLYKDAGLRESLIVKGFEQVNKFTWKKTAEEIAGLF